MRLDTPAKSSPIVSRWEARAGLRKALKRHIGHGKRFTVKQLARLSRVPARMVESAMCHPDSPDYRPLSQENLLSVAKVLGAEFASEWLALSGLGAFDLPTIPLPAPGSIAADAATGTAQIARMAADGQFCSADRRALREVGQRDIARGMGLVALGEELQPA